MEEKGAEYWMRRWDHAETDVYVSDDRVDPLPVFPESRASRIPESLSHSDVEAIKETSDTHFRVAICVSRSGLMGLVWKRDCAVVCFVE